jgi:hypothetical protein
MPYLGSNDITKLPKAEHEAQEWQAAMEGVDPSRDIGRTNVFGVSVQCSHDTDAGRMKS